MSDLFPTIDDAGPRLAPVWGLVELVSLSDTLQTRCGLDGDDDASSKLAYGDEATSFEKRIFWSLLDLATLGFLAPAVFVGPYDLGYEYAAGGSKNYFDDYGSLQLIIVDEDRDTDDLENSTELFLEFEGNVLADIKNQFASSDKLAGVKVQQLIQPCRPPVESTESASMHYWLVGYLVSWGVE